MDWALWLRVNGLMELSCGLVLVIDCDELWFGNDLWINVGKWVMVYELWFVICGTWFEKRWMVICDFGWGEMICDLWFEKRWMVICDFGWGEMICDLWFEKWWFVNHGETT